MDSEQPQPHEPVVTNRETLAQLVQHTVSEAQASVQLALDRARSAQTELRFTSRNDRTNRALLVQARVAVDKLARLRPLLEAQQESVDEITAYESKLDKVVEMLGASAATSIGQRTNSWLSRSKRECAEIDYDKLERLVAASPLQLMLRTTPQEQGLHELDTLERWHERLALKRRKRSYRAQRTAFRFTLVSLALGVSSLSAITFLPQKGDDVQRILGALREQVQHVFAKPGRGSETDVSAITVAPGDKKGPAPLPDGSGTKARDKQESLRWSVPASSVSEARRHVIEALTAPAGENKSKTDNEALTKALKQLDGTLDDVEVLPTQVIDLVKAAQEQSAKLWTTLAVVACVLLIVALGFMGWLVSKAMSLSQQHMAGSVQSEHRAGLARLAKVRLALHGRESVQSTLDQIALVPERRIEHDEDVEHDEA